MLIGRAAAAWRLRLRNTGRCYSTEVTKSSSLNDKKALFKRTSKSSTLVDSLAITVKGGQGGDGCIAFSRAKYVPYGPPSGASGGRGGNVYIEAAQSIASLARVASSHVAEAGQNGTGEWQVGKKGKDRIIRVPVGTVVTVQMEPPEEEIDERMSVYQNELKRRYRNAYLRERRQQPRFLNSTPPEVEGLGPQDWRDMREAVWRHYPGGSTSPGMKEEEIVDETVEEPTFSEDEIAEQEAIEEAESDIAASMDHFKEAQRRYAFALLAEDMQSELETSDRNIKWGIQEQIGAEAWSVDLIEETTSPLLLTTGGMGGLGNAFFLTSSNKSPKLATRGAAGQIASVHLEWKFKGDVGLIGLPNAGKSTFLKSVCETGSDVRVGSYAFTTLKPNVGVVRLSEEGLLGIKSAEVIEESKPRKLISDGSNSDNSELQSAPLTNAPIEGEEMLRFTLQDLPGLVEGASNDRGLGHAFLKHVERCLALYYVVDVCDRPWEDLHQVYTELESYQQGLSSKVRGVIANKCDLLNPIHKEKLDTLRSMVKQLHGDDIPVFNVSAKHRQGVYRVAIAMGNIVKQEHAKKQKKQTV